MLARRITHFEKAQLKEHLLKLKDEDRRLRFGGLVTDEVIEKYNKFNSSKLFSFKTNKSTNNIYILYSKIESKFYKISDLDINDSL